MTTMMGVPATYLFLAQEPGFASADLSSLRLAVVGGAPMPEALLETWQRARGRDRPGLRAHRGGAERPLPAARGRARASWASPGKPYPHVDVALRDPDSGALLEGAATGELRRARAERLRRLLAQPRGDGRGVRATGGCAPATSPSATTEGFYRIAGRLKDMVISGGENVYPAEIESVLHAHPAVAEAAVVGVPDERWGEVCAAFVVLRPGATATEDELREHCRARLARFKVPRTFALRRRAAAVGAGQGAEGRAAGTGQEEARERARRRASTAGRSRSAASARARRLLEAAENVFAELGYHDASIVKITEAAGVGQGTFYLYFASKKDDLRRARASTSTTASARR